MTNMGINFRKKKKILPWVYLNFSKSGISTTIGPKGANVNIGKKGTYLNTGIPGTGLYSRQKISGNNSGNGGDDGGNGNNKIRKQRTIIINEKSKITAGFLALFLGTFGAHRFYLKQYWLGFFYLIFFFTYIPTILSIIDAIVIFTMKVEKFDFKYNIYTDYKNCSSCGKKLTFMTTPTLGGGKLNDGHRVCLECSRKMTKIDSNFLISSKKNYDTNLVKLVLKTNQKPHNYSSEKLGQTTNNNVICSENLLEIQDCFEQVKDERFEVQKELILQRKESQKIRNKIKFRKSVLFNFLFSKQSTIELEEISKDIAEYIQDLNNQLENLKVDIDLRGDEEIKQQYEKVFKSSRELVSSEKIWEKISSENSSSGNSLNHPEIDYKMFVHPLINCEYQSLYLSDSNGGYFLFYPSFILKTERDNTTTFIDYRDIDFQFFKERIREDSFSKPSDTKIVNTTWYKTNKDGSPDRRYNDNYQISIMEYAIFSMATKNGIDKKYRISNVQLAENFNRELMTYLSMIIPPNERYKSANNSNYVSDFSRQYHSLLNDYINSLSKTALKLSRDSSISEQFNKTGQLKSKIEDFINGCIIYDLTNITKVVVNGQNSSTNLENFGVALISNYLINKTSNLLVLNSFEELKRNFENGVYSDVIEQVLSITEEDNPLSVSLVDTDTKKVVNKINSDLSLPKFLKVSENKLFDEYAKSLYQFANIITKADNTVTKEEEKLLKSLYQQIHNPLNSDSPNSMKIIKNDINESIDDALDELNQLIGLEEVKSEINTLINYIKVQKAREETGLKSSSISYHIVFTGNPGTGKTTVARIIAKIYKHLGILSEGQLVETDRSGLIAEYTGQTAPKVNRTIDSALNGILFIDEAYALVNEDKDNFGKEAVATLIKRMEDDRDKLVVILAGYTDEMKTFIDTNPGFKSRFNRYIEFPDYKETELFEIFLLRAKQLEYVVTNDAQLQLKKLFNQVYLNRNKSFGNGRFVRNVLEKTLQNQANRIAKEPNLTKEILTTIEVEDIN